MKMVYERPAIISIQKIQFETRHSWNPGRGNSPVSNGNGGVNFPVSSNPNPQPCGAGTAGNGNGNGNIGKCNPKVN